MTLELSQKRVAFDSAFLPEFLNNGWMLALDSNQILVGWGAWKESSEALSEPGTCSLFASDFYLGMERPWRFTPYWDIVDRDRFATAVSASSEFTDLVGNVNKLAQGFQWVEPKLPTFETSVAELRKGMAERGVKKGVPVAFAEASETVESRRLLTILRSLCAQPRNLYPYGFWAEAASPEKSRGMIGATPEILFTQKSPDALETVALAGTRAKDGDPLAGEKLLRDPKERYEHQLVIEDIKTQLAEVGDVVIGETRVTELPTLFHLMTRIQGKPRSHGAVAGDVFAQWISRLHPTPALGVSPRARGFEEIRRWDDGEARIRFGAPFGAVYDARGEMRQHCVVAIRNVQWQDGRTILGSGCGVVPESETDREWKELALKRDSVKRMLSL